MQMPMYAKFDKNAINSIVSVLLGLVNALMYKTTQREGKIKRNYEVYPHGFGTEEEEEVVMYVYFPSESKKFKKKSVSIVNPIPIFFPRSVLQFLLHCIRSTERGGKLEWDLRLIRTFLIFFDNFFDSEGEKDIHYNFFFYFFFFFSFSFCTKALWVYLWLVRVSCASYMYPQNTQRKD